MRLAYFGLPLGALLLAREGHVLDPVVLAPVPAPGRRRLSRSLPAAPLAGGLAAPELVERRLRAAAPELLVSWYWTRRLPPQWLEIPRCGGIGAHPSLLPRHRGPDPFFAAIDAGDEVTGVSVHRLTPEYDRGDVLARVEVRVGEHDSWSLARALDRPSLLLLRDVVRDFARGAPPSGEPQDETRATEAPRPSGERLRVDWTWETTRVLRRIRALSPDPGLPLRLASGTVTLTRALGAPGAAPWLLPGEAGVVGDRAVVRTADGAVTLEAALDPDGSPLGHEGLVTLVRAAEGLG